MENELTIPLKTVKHLMRAEIQEHYSTACQSLYNGVQRGFLHYAHRELQQKIADASTVEELEEVLSELDYRMSLQEWVNSL